MPRQSGGLSERSSIAAIGRRLMVAGGAQRSTAQVVLGLFLAIILLSGSARSSVASSIDWPGYLGGPLHDSASPATAITVANAASLKRRWAFRAALPTMTGQPYPSFTASPIVFQGKVYIGSNSGIFYALDEATGHELWHQFVGFRPKLTCGSGRGVTATASAAFDPVSGRPTVYIAGGDGYLYAFDAFTGAIAWRSLVALPSNTVNDYYNWASPLLANGRVYVGVSSHCDKPLVRGGVEAYDQVTGALTGAYWSVPAGTVGGAVWTSPAADTDGSIFVTTGTPNKQDLGDAPAVVRLNPNASRDEAWTVPAADQTTGDADFGGSPTVFTATINGAVRHLIGACNKNGVFYALDATSIASGPVWSFRVGIGTPQGVLACLAAASFDGSTLYLAGNATTVGGVSYAGSMRALDPATGAVEWETGLNSIVLGSPSINGSGIIAAATYGSGVTDGVYLINGATGQILVFLPTGKQFPQPVFADQYLLIASRNVLGAWSP